MPTDPFVAVQPDQAPRHRQSLPQGINTPPHGGWKADRPGELGIGQPEGKLHGAPGPNVGYAVSLVHRQRDSWVLGPHEYLGDASAVVAGVAMKRAAQYGRAPVKADVDIAVMLFGYNSQCDDAWVTRRSAIVHEADHHYGPRRSAIDLVSEELLRSTPTEVAARVGAWRATVEDAAPRH